MPPAHPIKRRRVPRRRDAFGVSTALTSILLYGLLSAQAPVEAARGGSAAANSPDDIQLAQSEAVIPLPNPKPMEPAPPGINDAGPTKSAGQPAFEAGNINPTGRQIDIVVPLRDGSAVIGDISLRIGADGTLSIPVARLVDLLRKVLTGDTIDQLVAAARGDDYITLETARLAGVPIIYDPALLELQLKIGADAKKSQSVSLADLDNEAFGEFVPVANFSAYLTGRLTLDYAHAGRDEGLQAPAIDLLGVINVHGVALETEAFVDFNRDDIFRRRASRAVIDWPSQALRFTLGDLRVVTHGFQESPEGAGLQLARLYTVLQPQRFVRPRGGRQFTLNEASEVEVVVNGQTVRRVRLDAGVYDLSDFPFAYGSNDVQVIARDATGREETTDFNVFFDRQLLEPGLFEFSLAGGIKSRIEDGEPVYLDNEWFVSGFGRIGVFDWLTLGASGQADRDGWQAGGEAIIAVPYIGVIAVDGAASKFRDLDTGWAVNAAYSRDITLDGQTLYNLSLFYEARSATFGGIGDFGPNNAIAWRASGTFTARLSDDMQAGLYADYARSRNGDRDRWSAGVRYGWRMTDITSLTADIGYERNDRGDAGFSAFVTISTRLADDQYAQASYDTGERRARLSYQRVAQGIVDTWHANADFDVTDSDLLADGALGYTGNRGEVSIVHSTSYAMGSDRVAASRTSLRAAATIAYAGGRVAIGRPVYDSFAIVGKHETLEAATIKVDPQPDGAASAETDWLDDALVSDVGSYNPRVLKIDAEHAPPGYNLGAGAYRVLPTYRSGAAMEVGSAYTVTAVGILIGADGRPVTLVTGTARALDDPRAPPVAIFTNRDGHFSAQGLNPGRWRIEMADPMRTAAVITIPEGVVGIYRAGEVRSSR